MSPIRSSPLNSPPPTSIRGPLPGRSRFTSWATDRTASGCRSVPRAVGPRALALAIVFGLMGHAAGTYAGSPAGDASATAGWIAWGVDPPAGFAIDDTALSVAEAGSSRPNSQAAGPARAETTLVLISPPTRAFESTMLSVAATVGPIAYLYSAVQRPAEFDVAFLAAFGGLMLGPALGYAYGGMPERGLVGVGVRVVALGLGSVTDGDGLLLIPISAAYDIVMLGPNLEQRARRRVIDVRTARLRTSNRPALAVHVSF